MSNNKYYTPSIEKFHEGFEYQFRVGSVWVDMVYNEGQALKGREFENIIRVKYLDREDIENEGWEDRGMLPEKEGQPPIIEHYWDSKRVYSLFVHRNKDETLHHIVIVGSTSKIFEGFIKNKSEFQQLQVQLQITKS